MPQTARSCRTRGGDVGAFLRAVEGSRPSRARASDSRKLTRAPCVEVRVTAMTRLFALWMTAALIAVAGATGVASAESVDGRDRRGDVRRYQEGDKPKAVPNRADGDLVGYQYRYSNHRFKAVLGFRELKRSAPYRYVGVLLTWTGEVQSEFTELEVEGTPRRPRGRATLDGTDCPVRHAIDYRRNRITMSFPTRCIDNPRVMKASATSAIGDRAGDPTVFFVDRMPRPGEYEGDNGVKVRRG